MVINLPLKEIKNKVQSKKKERKKKKRGWGVNWGGEGSLLSLTGLGWGGTEM